VNRKLTFGSREWDDALQARGGGRPREQQRVVVLRLVHGWPFADIAAALHADAAVCRTRFSRALRPLRGSLAQAAIGLVLALIEVSDEGLGVISCCV
jgi:DNA-directed RNA polymerase specialized sigma24 family protein